jgi:hypothetical protein
VPNNLNIAAKRFGERRAMLPSFCSKEVKSFGRYDLNASLWSKTLLNLKMCYVYS